MQLVTVTVQPPYQKESWIIGVCSSNAAAMDLVQRYFGSYEVLESDWSELGNAYQIKDEDGDINWVVFEGFELNKLHSE